MAYDFKLETPSSVTDSAVLFGATSETATRPTPFNITDVITYLIGKLATDMLPASDITLTPISGVTARDVQTAFAEYKGTLNTLNSAITGLTGLEASDIATLTSALAGLAASAISVSAISGVTGSNVQAVLAFLQNEIATNATSTTSALATVTTNVATNTSTIATHTTQISSLNASVGVALQQRVSGRIYFAGTM